jgi:hypothetical protein
MDELLEEYNKKFGEFFPLMCVQSCTDEDIEEIIKKCIKNNKPFKADGKVIY